MDAIGRVRGMEGITWNIMLTFSAAGNRIQEPLGFGGGIALWGSKLVTLPQSTTVFKRNVGELGGSGYLSQSNVIFDGKVSFSNSSAVFGGGIYLDAATTLSLLGRCSFIGNSAGDSGGGIYAWAHSALTFVTGSVVAFENNSCTRSGGGVMITGGGHFVLNGSADFKGGIQLFCCS